MCFFFFTYKLKFILQLTCIVLCKNYNEFFKQFNLNVLLLSIDLVWYIISIYHWIHIRTIIGYKFVKFIFQIFFENSTITLYIIRTYIFNLVLFYSMVLPENPFGGYLINCNLVFLKNYYKMLFLCKILKYINNW